MTTEDFEALDLRHGDRIWIQDTEGSSTWVKYLAQYDSVAQTFVFGVDEYGGLQAVVQLGLVRTVER